MRLGGVIGATGCSVSTGAASAGLVAADSTGSSRLIGGAGVKTVVGRPLSVPGVTVPGDAVGGGDFSVGTVSGPGRSMLATPMNICRKVRGREARPACIAGVLISLPNFSPDAAG